MLTDLPVETALLILSHLVIPSIHALQLVSKGLNQLVKTNESTIYRFAAVAHEFIPSANLEFDELRSAGVPAAVMLGIDESWKTICRRMFQLERNWKGLGPSELVCLPSAGATPASLQVDESEGIMINIIAPPNAQPGLYVLDMDDNQFNRRTFNNGTALNITKDTYYSIPPTGSSLARIPESCPRSATEEGSVPYPQPFQEEVSRKCFEAYKETYPKGHFVFHAAFPCSLDVGFAQIAFPTLIIKHTNPEKAELYDIPTRKLVQSISLATQTMKKTSGEIITLPPLRVTWTVLLSDAHVFLSSLETGSVRVFERESGACIFSMRSTDYGSRTLRFGDYGLSSDTAKAKGVVRRLTTVEIERTKLVDIVPAYHSGMLTSKSLCISTCGKHLLTCNAPWTSTNIYSRKFVVVRNFDEIPPGDTMELQNHAIQIDLDTQEMAF
ncbi:hypothetical protein PM082_002352 [Marasmius tenuissimus]|nr:hypothetical protein PM082_002352 [Marasmius tenuissimus]